MAVKYVTENRRMYEINERGERDLVRSSESNSRAFIRFTNKTSRLVDVWWRDFLGNRHHYVCLSPGGFADINTFVTHPWEFTDRATGENFVINNCIIYRADAKLGGMMFRTNWNITVLVRSLKYCAMLVVADMVASSRHVEYLGLPRTLEAEVKDLARTLAMEEGSQSPS